MATLRDHIDRIQREIPISQVLADLGYDVRFDGLREQQFSCDLHGDGMDRKPSARVYPESFSWYCFACSRARDAIDTVREKKGLTFHGAIKYLETTYKLPPLPWDDERPKETTPRPLLDPSRTFVEEHQAFQSTLTWVTLERTLPMDSVLAFWEALDQLEYKVQEGVYDEDMGRRILQLLREKLEDGLRGAR